MKKLMLGALLAVLGSSIGCSSSSESVVTARWSFENVDGSSAPEVCANYPTVTIYSVPWDPFAGTLGTALLDKFNCTDLHGVTAGLPDNTYQIWIQVETDNGGSTYAQSEHSFFDTANGDAALDFPLIADGGFLSLSWELENQSGAQVRCATGDKVRTTVSMSGSTEVFPDDRFPCEDGFGTTDPLPAGKYVVSVSAEDSSETLLGVAAPVTNVMLQAPSGLTDIGHVVIPLD